MEECYQSILMLFVDIVLSNTFSDEAVFPLFCCQVHIMSHSLMKSIPTYDPFITFPGFSGYLILYMHFNIWSYGLQMRESIKFLFFCVWITSFEIIFFRSTHLSKNIQISFSLEINNLPLQKYHVFAIHWSVEGHLCCFCFLTIVNRAEMNIAEQASEEY